ncbi:MAG: monofunctional biosynthetic peptidoglycan transglycosylase, partial [Thermoanaerobaculia bacterium]
MWKKAALAVAAAALLWVAWTWITFPDVARLRTEDPETTAFMELRKRELRRAGEDDELAYRFVPYERISRNFRRSVLVSEDNRFYDHEGVDVEGFKEAMRRNWENRSLTQGGSTITQQLAKNLYLSPSRNPLRKIEEYFIARALERHLSKKRILELYLNVVELGERVYGAEAAAQHYFGKSAASLTPAEAALLAAALPNPRVMNPSDPNRRLRARQDIILSRLRRWGHLAEEEVLTQRKPIEKVQVPPEPEPETETTTETIIEPPPATTTEPDPTTTEPPPTTTEPPPTTTEPTTTSTAPED